MCVGWCHPRNTAHEVIHQSRNFASNRLQNPSWFCAWRERVLAVRYLYAAITPHTIAHAIPIHRNQWSRAPNNPSATAREVGCDIDAAWRYNIAGMSQYKRRNSTIPSITVPFHERLLAIDTVSRRTEFRFDRRYGRAMASIQAQRFAASAATNGACLSSVRRISSRLTSGTSNNTR